MKNTQVEDHDTTQSSRIIKSQKSKRKKIILKVILIAAGILLLATGVIAYQITSNINRMIIPKPVIDAEQDDPIETPPVFSEEDEDFYLLVMGLDYRDNHNALLTDSIMVLHIIPQQSTIKLLSIPRDLLVENTRGSIVKINSLFSEGHILTRQQAKDNPTILSGDTIKLGNVTMDKAVLSGAIANTRNKLEEILDVSIQNTVLVNFNTLVALVDEVGGIEIDVKRSMKYRVTNLYLEPGLQTLNGEDALGYARFREDDRGRRYFASDFERGQQQQEVVKALADEIFTLKNSGKTLKLLAIVSENVQTDMDYSDMYAMVTNYYNVFNSDSFQSVPFPEMYSSKGDVILSDEARNVLRNSFKSLEIEEHEPQEEAEL